MQSSCPSWPHGLTSETGARLIHRLNAHGVITTLLTEELERVASMLWGDMLRMPRPTSSRSSELLDRACIAKRPQRIPRHQVASHSGMLCVSETSKEPLCKHRARCYLWDDTDLELHRGSAPFWSRVTTASWLQLFPSLYPRANVSIAHVAQADRHLYGCLTLRDDSHGLCTAHGHRK
jgi:hypothetical protein